MKDMILANAEERKEAQEHPHQIKGMPNKKMIAVRKCISGIIAQEAATDFDRKSIPQERFLAVEQDLERYFLKKKPR